MTGSTLVKLLAVGVLLSGVAACTPITATHGNFLEPDRLAEIHEGTSRKADVLTTLGTPSSVGTFDPNTWYYIGQRTEKVAFFAPEVVDRKVVVIRFDDNGLVRQIQQLDLGAGQEIDVVDRATPTAGKDLSFIEQMLGNVGRFGGVKKKEGPGVPGG